MANKEQLINNAKIIFVDNASRLGQEYLDHNIDGITKFLSDKPYLKLGSNKEEDFYKGDHHYTTKYWYSVLPLIAGYIGFDFNFGDFITKDFIVEEGDYSYLKPVIDKDYSVIVSPYENIDEEGQHKIIYINAQIFNYKYNDFVDTEVYDKEVNKVSNNYHTLYKFAHIPSTIINNGENNGRTLLISCNSHAIPLIPIFAYYFKKVIVLDNRFMGFNFSTLYKNEPDTIDTLLMLSYDNYIEKFLNENF